MRHLIIAGVQGCYYELQQLLKKCKFDRKMDILILLGDVVYYKTEPWHTLNLIYHLTNKNTIIVKGQFENSLEHYTNEDLENPWSTISRMINCFPSRELAFFHLNNLQTACNWYELPSCILCYSEVDLLKGNPSFDVDKPVVFGRPYTTSPLGKPFITHGELYKTVVYANTNCVYGNNLTAVIIEEGCTDGTVCKAHDVRGWQFVSVPALKRYI